jgi:RimJ/RimL family protein N-acetyltransferase
VNVPAASRISGLSTHLKTERLVLRPVAPSDAPALFAARGDSQVMQYWDWPEMASAHDVEKIILAHGEELESGRTIWWAVAKSDGGQAIGECDLSEIDRHHRRAEVGFLFARAYWRCGYATEAMQAVVKYAFDQLGLERLWARCHAGNVASVRLLERLGFQYEGTLRAHIVRDGGRRDCPIYGLMRPSH